MQNNKEDIKKLFYWAKLGWSEKIVPYWLLEIVLTRAAVFAWCRNAFSRSHQGGRIKLDRVQEYNF